MLREQRSTGPHRASPPGSQPPSTRSRSLRTAARGWSPTWACPATQRCSVKPASPTSWTWQTPARTRRTTPGVPDELVRAVGLVGSVEEITERLGAYASAGVDEVALVPSSTTATRARCTRCGAGRSDPSVSAVGTDDRSADSHRQSCTERRDGTAPQARIDDYRAKGYWNDDLIDASLPSVSLRSRHARHHRPAESVRPGGRPVPATHLDRARRPGEPHRPSAPRRRRRAGRHRRRAATNTVEIAATFLAIVRLAPSWCRSPSSTAPTS